MKSPDLKDFEKEKKPHKLLSSLPDYLKDPQNYERIQRSILEAGRTTCSHSDIIEWSKCSKCKRALWNRKEFMFKLGFKNAAQYMAWHAVHRVIERRVPLAKYNSK